MREFTDNRNRYQGIYIWYEERERDTKKIMNWEVAMSQYDSNSPQRINKAQRIKAKKEKKRKNQVKACPPRARLVERERRDKTKQLISIFVCMYFIRVCVDCIECTGSQGRRGEGNTKAWASIDFLMYCTDITLYYKTDTHDKLRVVRIVCVLVVLILILIQEDTDCRLIQIYICTFLILEKTNKRDMTLKKV